MFKANKMRGELLPAVKRTAGATFQPSLRHWQAQYKAQKATQSTQQPVDSKNNLAALQATAQASL